MGGPCGRAWSALGPGPDLTSALPQVAASITALATGAGASAPTPTSRWPSRCAGERGAPSRACPPYGECCSEGRSPSLSQAGLSLSRADPPCADATGSWRGPQQRPGRESAHPSVSGEAEIAAGTTVVPVLTAGSGLCQPWFSGSPRPVCSCDRGKLRPREGRPQGQRGRVSLGLHVCQAPELARPPSPSRPCLALGWASRAACRGPCSHRAHRLGGEGTDQLTLAIQRGVRGDPRTCIASSPGSSPTGSPRGLVFWTVWVLTPPLSSPAVSV